MSALDSFIDGSELSAAEAKREFFLTPADLKALPSRPLGAWGCGNTRLYNTDVLVAAAVAKYGADGLRKKKLAREVREDKKRKRVEDAADAEESLREGALAPAPGAAVADAAAVRGLVAEARRALKASCTWDYLRSKSAPHGASTSVRVERVDQAEYAAVIGREADPELRSVVKRGAWFAVAVPFETVFGETPIRGAGGKYGCNAELAIGGEEDDSVTVKYCPATRTMVVGAYVGIDTG